MRDGNENSRGRRGVPRHSKNVGLTATIPGLMGLGAMAFSLPALADTAAASRADDRSLGP
jgi:hypothetical protein